VDHVAKAGSVGRTAAAAAAAGAGSGAAGGRRLRGEVSDRAAEVSGTRQLRQI